MVVVVVVVVVVVDVVGDLVGAVWVVEGGVMVVGGVVVVRIGATVSDGGTSADRSSPQAMATIANAAEAMKKGALRRMCTESGGKEG